MKTITAKEALKIREENFNKINSFDPIVIELTSMIEDVIQKGGKRVEYNSSLWRERPISRGWFQTQSDREEENKWWDKYWNIKKYFDNLGYTVWNEKPFGIIYIEFYETPELKPSPSRAITIRIINDSDFISSIY